MGFAIWIQSNIYQNDLITIWINGFQDQYFIQFYIQILCFAWLIYEQIYSINVFQVKLFSCTQELT